MLQATKPIRRRLKAPRSIAKTPEQQALWAVTTGMVLAAVTAIPAVGLAKAPGDDKLLAVIRRYKSEVAAINASVDLSDEEIDAWTDRADAILVEAAGLPALTTASALAALDLVVKKAGIGSYSISTLGDSCLALIHAVRGYIASTQEWQS